MDENIDQINSEMSLDHVIEIVSEEAGGLLQDSAVSPKPGKCEDEKKALD